MGDHPLNLTANHYAFFFDIDGTLAELQATPEAVSIPPAVITNLEQLAKANHGALAVVSGRPLEQIDSLLAPLQGAAAGIHGAQLRTAQGQHSQLNMAAGVLAEIAQQLESATDHWPGVLIEKKPVAFALHYRQAPEYQQQLFALATQLCQTYPEFTLQPGKCVWEIKPRACNKGVAIQQLMSHPPFQGRVPLFVADDVTDEAGFHWVNQQQGVSIKVGSGQTAAQFRLQSVAQLHQWLEEIVTYQRCSKLIRRV